MYNAALLLILSFCYGVLAERDEWGSNWVWILLPLLIIAILLFACSVLRALHFRSMLGKAHEALHHQKSVQAEVQPTVRSNATTVEGPDTIALQRNQERIRFLEGENARLREENKKLKEELDIALGQLQNSRQELQRARSKPGEVVEKVVEKVVHVQVPQIVEVKVPQTIEVPRVVEKTVEVQRLVVDKAAAIQLQYAQDDIEYLKKELKAAKEKESLRQNFETSKIERTILELPPREPALVYSEANTISGQWVSPKAPSYLMSPPPVVLESDLTPLLISTNVRSYSPTIHSTINTPVVATTTTLDGFPRYTPISY